jgi:hypothetical protein
VPAGRYIIYVLQYFFLAEEVLLWGNLRTITMLVMKSLQ